MGRRGTVKFAVRRLGFQEGGLVFERGGWGVYLPKSLKSIAFPNFKKETPRYRLW